MVVKQIIFNEQLGRLILSDDSNNHYICDIYGNKKPCFLPDVSGCCTYKERIEKIKNSSQSVISIEKPIDNFNKNSHKYYIPTTRKFEGYCSFPNPLSCPFSNVKKNEISSSKKKNLLELLKNNFKNEKNKKMFEIPENQNKGADYFTYPLNPDDYSKQDRDNLIILIEKHFEEYKIENKYKLNLMPNDPVIRALKAFKKVLLENEDLTVINGRRLPSPSDEAKMKFEIINHKMKSVKLGNDNHQQKDSNKKSNNQLNNLVSEYNKEKMDLSFMSIESENERKYKEENSLAVKGLINLRKIIDNEKNMIDGFKEKPFKEEGIIRKGLKIRFKSNGDFYAKDMALLQKGKISNYYLIFKIVNPIAFELQNKKEEYDRKQLEKKKNQKSIFQKNIGF